MGGDGGVIASNRRYMRGAGTADHTGDYGAAKRPTDTMAARKDRSRELMTTCAASREKLREGDAIVACRLGRLYKKEAAVGVLLQRKQQQLSSATTTTSDEMAHVRKLSELYPVRGHFDNDGDSGDATGASGPPPFRLACPITSKPLHGTFPAVLLVRDDSNNGDPSTTTTNVVSEAALQRLDPKELEEEYGPIARRIRLAPPPDLLETLKSELAEERKAAVEAKKAKKHKKHKKKKEKPDTAGEAPKRPAASGVSAARPAKVARTTAEPAAVRSRVKSTLESNAVLSSLFVDPKAPRDKTRMTKDEKNDLFARL